METSSSNDLSEVIGRLERDPLRNIVLLKHIEAFPERLSIAQIADDQGVGTLVLLDAGASAFDRETYPEAAFAMLLSSDNVDLTRRLVGSVPAQCNVVFKLATERDRDAVADRFPISRAASFLSFTDGGAAAFASDSEVSIATSASDAELRLFETQGHARDWLGALLLSDRAFVCALEEAGELRSVCFAFENYRKIWEVGGVVTTASHRGRGLAARVVRTALAELRRRAF